MALLEEKYSQANGNHKIVQILVLNKLISNYSNSKINLVIKVLHSVHCQMTEQKNNNIGGNIISVSDSSL